MFERETRREKILEARNRELRLKQKTKMQAAVEIDEDVTPAELQTTAEQTFNDNFVKQAEQDFFTTIQSELAKAKPPEDPKDDHDQEQLLLKASESVKSTQSLKFE